jgi:hypothetical protein
MRSLTRQSKAIYVGSTMPETGYYPPPAFTNFDAKDLTQEDWLVAKLKSKIEKEWPSAGEYDHETGEVNKIKLAEAAAWLFPPKRTWFNIYQL